MEKQKVSGISRPVPRPRNLSSSSQDGAIENAMKSLSIDVCSAEQLSGEVQRLQTVVHDLRVEERRLIDHIASLKQEEQYISCDPQALKRKEMELSEREQDLYIQKSRIDGEFSDRESALRQKERDLQHLQDQLHMKDKDLKQKEFDIMNADSVDDLNLKSGEMAELADRQYELDRREQELKYREERMKEWSMNLQEKDSEYRKRYDALVQREAYLHSQAAPAPAQYSRYSGPVSGYGEESNVRTQEYAPQDYRSSREQGYAPQSSQVQGYAPQDHQSSRVQGYAPQDHQSSRVQRYVPQDHQSSQIQGYVPQSSQIQGYVPQDHQSSQIQGYAPQDHQSSQIQGYVPQSSRVQGNAPQEQNVPPHSTALQPSDTQQYDSKARPSDYPQHQTSSYLSDPIERGKFTSPEKGVGGTHSGQHSSNPAEKTAKLHQIRAASDQFSKDLELAKKMQEEEERNITKVIYTDEMLALTLQQEEMTDRLESADQSENGASLILKKLDERLTEEQRRKKQEEEDFLMAQRLSSGADDGQ